MPRSDIGTTLERIWSILDALSVREPKTADSLREHLEYEHGLIVSRKTVQRHLAALEDAQLARRAPAATPRKQGTPRPEAWLADPQRNLDRRTRRLTTDEALAFELVSRVADQLLPPEISEVLRDRFRAAEEHLRRYRHGDKESRWAEKVAVLPNGFALQPPRVEPNVLQTIQRAILQERQIRCSYRALAATTAKQYPLKPQALILAGTVMYLIAERADRPARKCTAYALHRFDSVELLDDTFQRGGFRLDEFLRTGGTEFGASGPPIRFKAWVSHKLQRMLTETPLSPDMTITPDKEGAIVTATVRQSWPFESWLLSRGPHLKVLEPEALAQQVSSALTQASDAYSKAIRLNKSRRTQRVQGT